MAQQTKTQLKEKFQDGDKPTGTDFSNLIDSLQQTLVAGTNITLTQNADGSVTISSNGGSAGGAVRYDIGQNLTLGNKLTARRNIGIVGLVTEPIDNFSNPIPTIEPGMVVLLQSSAPREITFNLDAFGIGDAAYIIAPGGFEPLPEKVMTSTGEIDYWPYYIGWTPGTPDPNPTPSSGDHTVAYIYTCVRLQDDSSGVSNMYVTRAPFRQGEIGGSSGSGGGSGSGGY